LPETVTSIILVAGSIGKTICRKEMTARQLSAQDL